MLYRYLILSVFLISCGSRKVEVKKDFVNTNVKTEIKTNTTEQIKLIDTSQIDEFIICPIVDSLPIVVNGITYKNARLTYKKTKVNKIYTNDKKIQQTERKQVKTQKKTLVKDTERTFNYWYWIIIVVVLIAFFYYLKRKTYI